MVLETQALPQPLLWGRWGPASGSAPCAAPRSSCVPGGDTRLRLAAAGAWASSSALPSLPPAPALLARGGAAPSALPLLLLTAARRLARRHQRLRSTVPRRSGHVLIGRKEAEPAGEVGACVTEGPQAVQSMGNLGILNSVKDLPKSKALGIELRSSAAVGAVVGMLDGSLAEPLHRIYHKLSGSSEENLSAVSNTVEQLVEHFEWKGVIGISITKEVAKRLGVVSEDFAVLEKEVGKLFTDSVGGKAAFCHTVVHTDAAGYNELVWGSTASRDCWSDQNVVVCTLGKNIGAVLFHDGHRVRNSPMKSVAPIPGKEEDGRFMPPERDTPAFQDWLNAIDSNLHDIIEAVPQLDRIILLPTGRTSGLACLGEVLSLSTNLPRTGEAAARKNCELVLSDQQEGAVVSGVALCGLVELETMQVARSLDMVLDHAHALHMLSEAQLHVIFDKIDAEGNDAVTLRSLQRGLEVVGVRRDVETLAKDFEFEPGDADAGAVCFDRFLRWWEREVIRARVVRVTSVDAWNGMLARKQPEGFGELIVLEVTFTFCRSCRRFDKVFDRMAETYKEVRFVQFVANATIGGIEYCTKELGVKVSPGFLVFRRGGELLKQWSGANTERFEANLKEAIASQSSSPV